jgi:cation diffusion facilitator family transporter
VRIRAGAASLVGGVLICAGKFGAWSVTASTAVLSDALESVVNVVAATLLLYGLIVAARPADRDHPYGHGKVEFFTAGVEGGLIVVAAGLILWEAATELWLGPHLRRPDAGLVMVGALALANALLASYLIRVGRSHQSLALVADGKHLMTDVVTSVGVMLGLGGVWLTGWKPLDPLVAIAVAGNILRTGWLLLRSAVGGLMDEADPDQLARMVGGLQPGRRPWWIDMHGLRAWRPANLQHVDLHVVVPRYFDAERLHEIDREIGRALLERAGLPGDVIIHFDPCRPRHCRICRMPECPVRSGPFEHEEALTLERVTRAEDPLHPEAEPRRTAS